MADKSHQIVVVFLGGLREAAGQRTVQLQVESSESTVEELRRKLEAQFPMLVRWMPSVRFALDSRYVDPAERIGRAVELALIPPVAGG